MRDTAPYGTTDDDWPAVRAAWPPVSSTETERRPNVPTRPDMRPYALTPAGRAGRPDIDGPGAGADRTTFGRADVPIDLDVIGTSVAGRFGDHRCRHAAPPAGPSTVGPGAAVGERTLATGAPYGDGS